MLVSDLLEGKGFSVATVTGQATVGDVVADLVRHRVGALVVSPDGRQIEGIVSERDVVQHLSELRIGLLKEKVSSIMSTSVRVCTPTDDVEAIMNLMTERRIRHVPVVEGGLLCGIISIGDVVKSRIGELEKDFPRVKESLLSAMGNLQTGRLLDPRYLDLEGGDLTGNGDEPESEPLTVLR